ncbi:RHS repeat domain-containing protein [Kribbella albertanoniae]|uniref:RHS repeat protein n=1 Tax=Kribbella albertanoniae TaxID=1266829 RepID=A0A4R4Q122_9ACTN|nr:RHS repeat-associated core domain-containing protein [Kribbella albertanoniae]TDC28610.1 RHS repeat protein [Kribbella albertanoniae]
MSDRSTPRTGRRVRPLVRTLLTGFLGLSLVVGSQQQGMTAAAAAPEPDKPVALRQDKPVKGVTAKPVPRPADPAMVDATRKKELRTSWPAAGSAEAAVPTPGGSTTLGRWNAVLSGQPKVTAQRAGSLPVWVSAGAAATKAWMANGVASGPAKVQVAISGRRDDRMQVDVRRADGSKAAGTVRLTVNYAEFADTYGGGWSNRLRLYDAKTGKSYASSNKGDGTVQADVPATSTLMLAAAESGGGGDYSRGDLSGGAAKWSIGGPSGAFEWSMPMEAPPGIGGPQPSVALQYSSASLDGLTSATNNQVSAAGQGFDISGGGAIERRFKSCSKDPGNNGTRSTGDQCFATENASIAMTGKSGDMLLVSKTDTSETWRLMGDDGTVIEKFWGAANGDEGLADKEKGEYWRVTVKDGSRFYFGLNRLPGWTSGQPETRSALTMPVFGNNAGEQCNRTAFADSWCQQAYRWQLDYVVDRHGNTMSLFYDTETNNYARNMTASAVSPYARNSILRSIEYGQRDGQVYSQKAVGRVLFTPAERCEGTNCGPGQPATYPDTPWDLNCASTTNCDNHFTPSFWTQKRLSRVTTQVWRASDNAFTDVQTWDLRHEYTSGAGSGRSLWLEGVTQTGRVGGDQQLPETNFDGVGMDNRVNPADPNLPSLIWYRIDKVHYGTGGDLAVGYSLKDCTATSLPDPANNTRLCRPQKWTPPNQAERQDWFHKFVVKETNEVDRSAATTVPAAPVPVTTTVQYVGTPAWHFDEEDGLSETTTKTWNEWRGYEKVKVIKGAEGETQSTEETQYFRGMNGDKDANGGVRKVTITDSTGTVVEDTAEFAGQVREQITYSGATVVNKSINDYWRSPEPTATETKPWGTRYAYLTAQKGATQYQAVDGGTLNVANRHEYDAKGRLLSKHLGNDAKTPDDDTCTRYEYLDNPVSGLQELLSREQTVSVGCDKPWSSTQVLSDERILYDDHTALAATPTRGVPTKGERLSGHDSSGNPTYETVFTATYDEYGRRTSVTNAMNQTTRMAFNPGYGPTTKAVRTAPNGMQVAEEYEPAWGEQIAEVSPDGLRAEIALDPVGRTSKVWNPGHPKATSAPDVEKEYLLRGEGSSAVITRARLGENRYDTTYELFDGLQRLRQTQEATPVGERLVTDYRYDSRGKRTIASGAYLAVGGPGTDILYVGDTSIPKLDVTQYDGANRPVAQIFLSEGQEKYRTKHEMTATRQSIDPPQGQAPTTRLTDARGRLIEQRQYTGDTWTGAYDSTKYTYTALGQLKSITDPAGNLWSYEYDIRGRRTSETDPDRGTTTFTFNPADQITSSTDARGAVVAFTYDELGRKLTQRSGSETGPVQIEWKYDSLALGKPTSTTRYVDGKAYTSAITGYDTAGRPTGQSLTLPASEDALAGTYNITQTYTADGKLESRSLPAVGDLAAEKLSLTYNDQSLPTAMSSELGTYVRNSSYTALEETQTLTLGAANGRWVQQKFEYEYGTRRVTRVITDRETSPRRISDTQYAYDPAGNITKAVDGSASATAEATDTQCFTYDHQRRLTEAWTPGSGDCAAAPTAAGLGGPAAYWQSWTFDKVGNRLSEKSITPTGATTTSAYTYGGTGLSPNALKNVTTTGPSGTASTDYGYDNTGNLTTRTKGGSTETLKWTDEGKLESSTKGSSFVYDGEGNRMLRRDASGTTLYLGETEILLGTDGKLHGTRYYTFGDDVVAVRTNGKLSWLLSDLHGTPNIAVDAGNQSVQRRRTTPYGQTRGTAPADWPGQRGFHKGTEDPGTGLVHLGAREYDPTIGRFISVDPEIDPEEPGQMNAYSYANNNPVVFDDSDGRAAVLAIPIAITVVEMAFFVVVALIIVVLVVMILVKVIELIVELVRNFFTWLWEKITKRVERWVEKYRTVWKIIEQRTMELRVRIVNKIKWIYKKIADKIKKPVRKPDPPKPKVEQPKPPPQTTKPDAPKPQTNPNKSGKPEKPSRGNAGERIKQEREKSPQEKAELDRRMREVQERLNEKLGNPKSSEWKNEISHEVDPQPDKYPDGSSKLKSPYDSKDYGSMSGRGKGWKAVLVGDALRKILDGIKAIS